MQNPNYVLSAGLEFFFALISVILMIGCLLDHNRKRKTNRMMIIILITHALMNAVDACVWLWCDEPEMLLPMKIFSFLSYALGCGTIAMFSLLLFYSVEQYAPVPKWIPKAIISLGGLMALLWVISLFNDMYYYWDENGVCHTGEFFWVSQMFGVVFFVCNIILVLKYRNSLNKKNMAVLILYNGIPLLAYAFVPLWNVLPIYTASTIVLLLYYIVIHVEYGRQVAEKEKLLLQKDLELSDSRVKLLLGQIQPHFIFNSLLAIQELCMEDPPKAAQTVRNFSKYLRGNLDAMSCDHLIPFSQELEHIRHYVALEQADPASRLNVIYNLEATDFGVPPPQCAAHSGKCSAPRYRHPNRRRYGDYLSP